MIRLRTLVFVLAVLCATTAASAGPIRYQYDLGGLWVGFTGDVSGLDFDHDAPFTSFSGYLRFTLPDDVDPTATALVLPGASVRLNMGRSVLAVSAPLQASIFSDSTRRAFTISLQSSTATFAMSGASTHTSALAALMDVYQGRYDYPGTWSDQTALYRTADYRLYTEFGDIEAARPVRALPEPATATLMLAGLGAAGLMRRAAAGRSRQRLGTRSHAG